MAVSNQFIPRILTVLALVINLIALILYKHGDDGHFMGASYNKNRDAETLASGVYVGYLLYNLAVLICSFRDSVSLSASPIDPLMNFVGFIIWLITGGSCIHFWVRFVPDNHFSDEDPSAKGVAMGALTLVNSAIYLALTFFTCTNYRRSGNNYS